MAALAEKNDITVTISQEARIFLAHDALSFEGKTLWSPENQARHLREQNAMARKHLQAIINHNTCPLTEDLKHLQQQINLLLSNSREALNQLNQNDTAAAIEALNQNTELCHKGETA